MKLLKIISIFFTSLISLNACVTTSSNYTGGSSNYGSYRPVPKPVATTEKWFLTKLNNAPYQGPRITFQISSNKRVNGFSGCNRYFASVNVINNNQLRVSSVGSTKKLCIDHNNNQVEKKYLQALRGVTNFERNRNQLVLKGNSSHLVFYKKSAR